MNPSRGELCFSVPSKTFLIGEYAVLNGGQAIVMGHRPRFQLFVRKDGLGLCEGIHPKSPAGQWMRKFPDRFKEVSVRFIDPHAGRGGFGASSAQFVLAYAFQQSPSDSFLPQPVLPDALWQAYRSLDHGDGQLPSGADVMAQLLGQSALVGTTPLRTEARPWPFADFKVLFFATGHKVATHEHLRERLPVSDRLLEISETAATQFRASESAGFLQSIIGYGEELERLHLVTAATRGLIAEVASLNDVMAVKGCGALGADVLAVVVPTANESVRLHLQSHGLRYVSSTSELADGLKLEVKLAPVIDQNGPPTWA